ncbi:phospholipase D-like domain-containing protein [Rhodoferax sp.]|uniref:phospholipase D-like domain-containing protein n=1 Tax=Rhodoferax sp. TaxID=50421 RepID=UPI0025CDEC7F|nr:phospholipase D-like domain-containing protein [Rhodoferax sp.]
MLHDIFTRQWITLHSALVLLGLGIYITGSHTLKQRRHPSAAIAWTISLVLLPYIALPLYLVFGRRKLASTRRVLKPVTHTSPQPATAQEHLATALGLGAAATFESLAIHQNGHEARHSLQKLIAEARHTLDICTFILGRDVLGDAITAQLLQRTRQGLKIRLLLDGIGIYLGGHPNLKRLRAAGIQVTLFVPPFRSPLRGRTNLRNHRKMAVADGIWLWCGGRNLAAEYFEGDTVSVLKKPVWIDLSFDLQGDLARHAQQRFEQDWTFATTGKAAIAPPWVAPDSPTAGQRARLVPSGPDQADDTFYTLLVSGCFTAQTRILAVTPYFVPDQSLLMALTLAARRGVAVNLVLPRQSNHRLADIARHAALRELVTAGAHIWLLPTMVHAKAVLIDHDLALVGSANLDERSLFLNYELMVAFYDRPVVQQFADWIGQLQSRALPYQPKPPSLRRELVEGLVRWVAFQL